MGVLSRALWWRGGPDRHGAWTRSRISSAQRVVANVPADRSIRYALQCSLCLSDCTPCPAVYVARRHSRPTSTSPSPNSLVNTEISSCTFSKGYEPANSLQSLASEHNCQRRPTSAAPRLHQIDVANTPPTCARARSRLLPSDQPSRTNWPTFVQASCCPLAAVSQNEADRVKPGVAQARSVNSRPGMASNSIGRARSARCRRTTPSRRFPDLQLQAQVKPSTCMLSARPAFNRADAFGSVDSVQPTTPRLACAPRILCGPPPCRSCQPGQLL